MSFFVFLGSDRSQVAQTCGCVRGAWTNFDYVSYFGKLI